MLFLCREILLILFIDMIPATNPTGHCSKQIGKSKGTKTEENMCYAITQSSCLDDYRSAKYG
jgi:hypothetical protein